MPGHPEGVPGGGRIIGQSSQPRAGSQEQLEMAFVRQQELNAALWKSVQDMGGVMDRIARAMELEHLPHTPGVTEVVVTGDDESAATTWGIYCIACTQARGDYTGCMKPGEDAVNLPNKWPLSQLMVERPMPEPPIETGGT
jgi:hypothetical protein